MLAGTSARAAESTLMVEVLPEVDDDPPDVADDPPDVDDEPPDVDDEPPDVDDEPLLPQPASATTAMAVAVTTARRPHMRSLLLFIVSPLKQIGYALSLAGALPGLSGRPSDSTQPGDRAATR
jgi:hypothetical protein